MGLTSLEVFLIGGFLDGIVSSSFDEPLKSITKALDFFVADSCGESFAIPSAASNVPASLPPVKSAPFAVTDFLEGFAS